MKCDIIIPVWNQLSYTKKCITSIKQHTKMPYRLIIIDNASNEDTRDYLRGMALEKNNVALIRNEENLGFIKAVNKGLMHSNSEYVCIMNNDTQATDRWLTKMIDLAESRKDIGLVNPQSESPGSMTVDEYAKELERNKARFIETNQCLGFCMLVKREVIDRIGYLDEIFDVGGFDDTDFSMRAHRAGYKCVVAGNAYVYHKWHTSFKKAGNRERLVERNEKIFFDRWGKYLRIAYPLWAESHDEFLSDLYTSVGLAREWNWVHAWIGVDDNSKRVLESIFVPRHQNLRRFYLSKNKFLFYVTVLFKLVERSLKGKKQFDAVLISDPETYKILSLFKVMFRTPICYVERKDASIDIKDENSWSKRANVISGLIREEIKK